MYIDILTRRDKYEIMLRASNITRLYIIIIMIVARSSDNRN